MIFYVAFFQVFGIYAVNTLDMKPTIQAGDIVFYYRLVDQEKLYAQDLVLYEVDGEQYLGRIIAKNEDEIDISDDHHLVINGATTIESNIYYKTYKYESDVTYPVHLKENEYFILSDAREGGKDSRYFGAIHFSQIKGILFADVGKLN